MHATDFKFSAAEEIVVECNTNDMPFFKQFSISSANTQRHITRKQLLTGLLHNKMFNGLSLSEYACSRIICFNILSWNV